MADGRLDRVKGGGGQVVPTGVFLGECSRCYVDIESLHRPLGCMLTGSSRRMARGRRRDANEACWRA